MVINHFQIQRKNDPKLNSELTLISYKNESTVKIISNGSPDISKLMYRKNFNSGWLSYTINQLIELNKGEYIQFKNLDTCAKNTSTTTLTNYIQFVMTGKFKSSGTLENKNKTKATGRFAGLFKDCSALLTGPNINLREYKADVDGINDYYTDIGLSGCFENCINMVSCGKIHFLNRINCVKNLFKNCTSLKYVSELKDLQTGNDKYGNYINVFNNCISLKKVPKLKNFRYLTKDQSANLGFNGMFENCISLEDVTNFDTRKFISDNNTYIISNCFKNTFANCTSLKIPPDFYFDNKITELKSNVFYNTFNGCSSLIQAPKLIAKNITTVGNNCFTYTFKDCISLVNEINLSSLYNCTLIDNAAFSGTFYGCTSLTNWTSYLPNTNILNKEVYRNTFRSCSSLITAPQFYNLSAIISANSYCCASMFNSCTSLTSGIELPNITTFNDYNQFNWLYENCINLKEIKVNFLSWNDTNNGNDRTLNWVKNVNTSGKFICPAELSQNRGNNFIPNNWEIETF